MSPEEQVEDISITTTSYLEEEIEEPQEPPVPHTNMKAQHSKILSQISLAFEQVVE